MKRTYSNFLRLLVALSVSSVLPVGVHALDLLPGIFDKPRVTATIWELGEQYVNLVEIEKGAPPNDHPATVDPIELEQALASLQLWTKGGVFRDEESSPVFGKSQAGSISRFMVDALAKASPQEDVTFNLRSYAEVMLSVAKEREWTTGRVFFKNGRVNLVIGEYRKRVDKGKKNVEGSFGITEDYRDVNFDVAGRNSKGHMPGRIVNTAGVELGAESRSDWVTIDVLKAAKAYRDIATPVAQRKEEERMRNEAAKLTLERREMREEMARMRKQMQALRDGGAATGAAAAQAQTLEERLTRLQQLLDKGLITADDFKHRKQTILEEI